jgi:hypothetical protein
VQDVVEDQRPRRDIGLPGDLIHDVRVPRQAVCDGLHHLGRFVGVEIQDNGRDFVGSKRKDFTIDARPFGRYGNSIVQGLRPAAAGVASRTVGGAVTLYRPLRR